MKEKVKKQLNPETLLKKYIIQKFVPKEFIVWPKEYKAAKRLIKHIPDKGFWEKLEIPFEIKSLFQLTTPKSLTFLRIKFNEMGLAKKEVEIHKMGKEKIGKDIVSENNKPKNMMEFLNE
jgi:hypothetical protein